MFLVGTNIFPIWFKSFLWENTLTVHIPLYFPILFFLSAYLIRFKPKLSNHLLLWIFVCPFSYFLCSHTSSYSKGEMLVRWSTMEVKGSMKLVLQQSNPLLQHISNLEQVHLHQQFKPSPSRSKKKRRAVASPPRYSFETAYSHYFFEFENERLFEKYISCTFRPNLFFFYLIVSHRCGKYIS